jgi:7-keto-8-aminopelargonate synthetase-like enzyme
MGEGDIIFSDERNHASIIDGCRLARAEVRIYRHLDMAHLATLLEAEKDRRGQRLLISETTFSMDGDQAPLKELCDVAKPYQAWVMVDEAHAFGIRGARGTGLLLATALSGVGRASCHDF